MAEIDIDIKMTDITVIIAAVLLNILNSPISIYANQLLKSCGDQNWETLILYSTIVSLAIPFILLARYLTRERFISLVTVFYGLMGLVSSSVAYSIIDNTACTDTVQSGDDAFLIIFIILSIIVILVGALVRTYNLS